MKKFNKSDIKEVLKQWIVGIDKEEKMPEGIVALNFGLHEPYGIELIGSCEYDSEDDDWACNEDFVPKERICEGFSIPEEIGWEEVLEGIAEILTELMEELKDINILNVEHITTGFCDGDLVVIK